ncbi:teichoic acid D-Ala incorporation-associated protein DltX [Lacticaseibacillus absianus]|nr:teichoic acid D-Ala incorporation-associated protein DltX [Lacticaseibacillus absianus]
MQTLKRWWAHPTTQFVAKTLGYAAIILVLVYLYSYRGVGGGHFIYNEF